MNLSISGDWDAWIAFFAQGAAASATESQRKVERLVALQNELRRRVQDSGRRGAAERLAGDLVGRPFVNRAEVASRYELSGQGAMNAIRALSALGILTETNTRTQLGTVFVAHEVVAVLAD